MEKARNSSFLKIMCYIIIPILIAILVLSIFHLAFLEEYGDIKDANKYIDSEQFANEYFSEVANKVSGCERVEKGYSSNYIKIEDEKGDYYYFRDERNNNNSSGILDNINYIIIDRDTNIMYTNIKSEDYSQEMSNMKNARVYWNFVDGNIETNLEHINSDNIKYNYTYFYETTRNTNETNKSHSLNDYDVYTSYNKDEVSLYTAYGMNQAIYEYMMQNRNAPIYGIVISLTLLIMIICYLFWSLGHKDGNKIHLNSIDNIPYEILAIICFSIVSIFLSFLIEVATTINYMNIIVGVICYLICYVACAIMGVTTIKRIKAKKFLKSFLTYKIIAWFLYKIKKIIIAFNEKTPENKKIFWYYIGFILISITLSIFGFTLIALILLVGFWIWTYYKIRKYIIEQEKIKEALKNIYEGNTDIELNSEELTGVLKEMSIYVKDIAGGFSNAIQESLKSERLKTELITNVSHDIKTPLTSIINYVDLLKKENIQDEKVKEYIGILEQKSQRLKKLTEDLVEASKVSSGNVKLVLEEIKIKELLNQTIGEFKDRLEEKNLSIELQMPNEESKIKADSRYLYRVIENLFSNITKYALENSRVYIDVKENNKKIYITIKNISREKLNISSDELMQRFVRGDKSRYTEGSGLRIINSKKFDRIARRKI